MRIEGINDSYAEKTNGEWLVHGGQNVLDQQNPGEFAYLIDTNKKLINLDPDTPVYAGVHNFDASFGPVWGEYAKVTDCFETAQDLLDLAKTVIDDMKDRDVELIDNVENDEEAVNELAEHLLYELTWQSPESYVPEFEDDIEDSPESYSEIIK